MCGLRELVFRSRAAPPCDRYRRNPGHPVRREGDVGKSSPGNGSALPGRTVEGRSAATEGLVRALSEAARIERRTFCPSAQFDPSALTGWEA